MDQVFSLDLSLKQIKALISQHRRSLTYVVQLNIFQLYDGVKVI